MFHLRGTDNLTLFDYLYHATTLTELFHCLTQGVSIIHISNMKMLQNIYTPSTRLSLCLVGKETTRVNKTILSLLAIAGTTCMIFQEPGEFCKTGKCAGIYKKVFYWILRGSGRLGRWCVFGKKAWSWRYLSAVKSEELESDSEGFEVSEFSS